MSDTPLACPCGAGECYDECCGRYIDGEASAPNVEALMRSRYTAFTQESYPYLMQTWHPDTRPESLDGDEPSNWIGLEIVSSGEEGDRGQVEFVAKLIYDQKVETLHELSDFERVEGCWLYVEGEFLNDGSGVKKISKNEDCPCNSGKKFKRCHGAA